MNHRLNNFGPRVSLIDGMTRIQIIGDQSGEVYTIPVSEPAAATQIQAAIDMGPHNNQFWFDQILGMKREFKKAGKKPLKTPVMEHFPELEILGPNDLRYTKGVTFLKFGCEQWMALLHTGKRMVASSPECGIFLTLLKGLTPKIKEVSPEEAKRFMEEHGIPVPTMNLVENTSEEMPEPGNGKKKSRKPSKAWKQGRSTRRNYRMVKA